MSRLLLLLQALPQLQLVPHVMHVLPQYVDLLQEHHVLLHDPRVLLLVHVLILLQHLPQIVDAVLEVLPSVRVLSVDVEVAAALQVVLQLLLHVLLVEVHGASAELLVVGDGGHYVKDVLLELLLEDVLLVDLDAQVGYLVGQALLTHTQVVYYEGQVLVHTVEVFEL